jgi:hypothetical protein
MPLSGGVPLRCVFIPLFAVIPSSPRQSGVGPARTSTHSGGKNPGISSWNAFAIGVREARRFRPRSHRSTNRAHRPHRAVRTAIADSGTAGEFSLWSADRCCLSKRFARLVDLAFTLLWSTCSPDRLAKFPLPLHREFGRKTPSNQRFLGHNGGDIGHILEKLPVVRH